MPAASLIRRNESVGQPLLLSAAINLDYPGRFGVLRDVRLELARGEILGLVGESGSGKSSVALAILRLAGHKGARVSGLLRLDGRDLLTLAEKQMRTIRGKEIALVLQSPLAALNPALRIGAQFEEAWRAHRKMSKPEFEREVKLALQMVSLAGHQDVLRKYPGELSVGLAQRVLIALAILHRPRLLIADEPTSALDMITQSEILGLFARLRRELNMAILYISHDLLSVAALCDRVAIMKDGAIVECASTEAIFRSPRREYTQALVRAIPRPPVRVDDPYEPAQRGEPDAHREERPENGARALLKTHQRAQEPPPAGVP
ncbi:MAG TPA: ABC transporter ATP-binding protein [Bryobacteraceae bacterium]|nr:ABC transporter ATP-binding protein [Bryobacteraceae bacterium]